MKITALLLAIAFLSCQTPPAPPPAAVPATPTVAAPTEPAPPLPKSPLSEKEQLEAMAQEVLANIVAGRFAEAERYFDTQMSTALPPAKLGEFTQQLNAQVGAYKSVGKGEHGSAQGYRVVVLPAEFERAKVNVRVVFDADGKIAGLFFQPAAQP